MRATSNVLVGAPPDSTTSRPSKVKCELCGQHWLRKEIKQHMGAHILCETKEEWLSKYKVDK